MTRSIKHVFSKEVVSVLLKNKIFLNRQGKKDYPLSSNPPENRRENRSQYGIRLREFKKIMVLYGNLSKGYLKKKIKQFHNTPTKTEESFFRYLESRLDVVLCRASFFDSIRSAKQAIQSGGVQVNQITVTTPAQILKPGDIVNFIVPSSKSETPVEVVGTFQPLTVSTTEEKSYASHRPNKEIVESKNNLLFEKVERLVCKIFNDKKRNSLAFQKLIPLILFSTREERSSLNASTRYSKESLASSTSSPNNVEITRETRIMEESDKKIAKAEIVSNSLPRLFAKVIESQKGINFWKGIKISNFPNYAKKIFRQNPSTVSTTESFHNSTKLYPASTISSKTRATNIQSLEISRISEIGLSFFEEKKKKADTPFLDCITSKPFQQESDKFYPDYTNRDYCIVLSYYLHLKRMLEKNHTIKQASFSEDKKILKKGKPAHLEISYTSLSIVFLFPPQHIRFSDFINTSKIFR